MNETLRLIKQYKCVTHYHWEKISIEHIIVKVVVDINRVEKGSEINHILTLLKNTYFDWELTIKN
jgi:hypothetical protein